MTEFEKAWQEYCRTIIEPNDTDLESFRAGWDAAMDEMRKVVSK